MAYSLLTAFIDVKLSDDDPPEEWARVYAERWSQLPTNDLEAELLPLFKKITSGGHRVEA